MQYETIILELLARIKKLEEDVAELQQRDNIISDRNDDCSDHIYHRNTGESTIYNKMTDAMIDSCYQSGKKLLTGGSVQDLADNVSSATGMNRNSAIMYLYVVQNLLEGTAYKRAISARALKAYFDNIFNEYGRNGLKNALNATRLHIAYRRACGHTVDSIEEICDRYETKL